MRSHGLLLWACAIVAVAWIGFVTVIALQNPFFLMRSCELVQYGDGRPRATGCAEVSDGREVNWDTAGLVGAVALLLPAGVYVAGRAGFWLAGRRGSKRGARG